MSLARLPVELQLRSRPLNPHRLQVRGRDFVLCWLQQALRGVDNPILDAAISIANSCGLPLLVYHGVGCRYPYASHRLHQFILEASKDLERDLAARGIGLLRHVERPDDARGAVYSLAERAAVVVTDDQPAFVARRQAESFAKRARASVLAVDATCTVPMRSFSELIPTTKGFRAAHRALRTEHLEQREFSATLDTGAFQGALPITHTSLHGIGQKKLRRLIGQCGVDMTLPPAPQLAGGRKAALSRLRWAIQDVLPNYNFRRNNAADPTAGSRLSAYLHFGVLSPGEVVRAVNRADVHAAPRWKFLDELLTWREFFHHLARFEDRPSSYDAVPLAARRTLEDHRNDPREALYSLDQLLHGETSDETWNAAQKQYLYEGYMHNNLRMYWGKQLIGWHRTPEDAWSAACYLNDRLSLDGRDPATYGNLQWCFGRSKKAYRETPVYGWVPRKSDTAMRKRRGMREWLGEQAQRCDFRISVPGSTSG